LELGQDNPLSFRPGDHLAVLPANRPALVEELLGILNISDPDVLFSFTPTQESLEDPFNVHPLSPSTFTPREAFSDLLDITTPPKPELLRIFAQFANDPNDKVQLQELAKGQAEYETWVQHHFPTIPEALSLFSVRVPVALLLEKLPRQQPRFYSISSSPKLHPTEVHLTVSVVHIKP
jgi:sulfite reductase alpha subunit-like flavoprotein